MIRGFIFSFALLVALGLFADDQKQSQPTQSDLDMATESMSHGHHHEMGPHMHMSKLREAEAGDEQKAQVVVDQARQTLERYKDYRVALAEGFKIFLPNIPQPMYHFSKWENALAASFSFDATKPTSLLYEKDGSGYKLIGAMYTAPYRFAEDQLNERIPLSVAQWHQHVNFCRPPRGKDVAMLAKNPQFGMSGSISTKDACEAAGGTFIPHVFGWMVHVYPWEKSSDAIWAVERQMKNASAGHEHDGMEMSH